MSEPLNVVVVFVGDGDGVGLELVVVLGDGEGLGLLDWFAAGAAPPSAASAPAASTRPYATTEPMFIADVSIAELTWVAVTDDPKDRARPARPATTGVAADVPQNEP